MKPGFFHVDAETIRNPNFRKVAYTAAGMQLVFMSLEPLEEIGIEVHHEVDQFFRIEKGAARFDIGKDSFIAREGDAVIVPRGTCHNVVNISATSHLKMYTIYSPPNHPPKRLQLRKPPEKHSKECRG